MRPWGIGTTVARMPGTLRLGLSGQLGGRKSSDAAAAAAVRSNVGPVIVINQTVGAVVQYFNPGSRRVQRGPLV
jgi:hypothetical protein